MNPFTRDLGVHQGRVVSATTAAEGDYVYELGHALLQDGNVAVGDYHQISQSFVLSAQAQLLRVTIRIVVPPVLPAGAAWEVSGWLNGTKMVARRLRPSKRVITLSDLRISLFGAHLAPSTNTVAVRLELI